MAELRGNISKARIALLTVTVEEYAVVSDIFDLNTNLPGTPYFVSGRKRKSFDVVGRRAPGQTNVLSEQAAGDLIEDFRPDFLIVVGTAGGCHGRDGVQLGDVVVADYIDYSGYWKLAGGHVLPRKNPHDHPSLYLHEGFIERLRVQPRDWRAHIRVQRPPTPGEPNIHIGNLVSGDILLGDASSPAQQYIINHFDKAIAFEMEAFGVARAVFQSRRSVYYNPQFLIVRGISDFVDADAEVNLATRRQWTAYAVSTAAAVGYTLVDRLLKTPSVDWRSGVLGRLARKWSDWTRAHG